MKITMDMVQRVEGRRRSRTAEAGDIEALTRAMSQYPDADEIRIYAGGFVANAFKYRAPATMLVATKLDDGAWLTGVNVYDAKRSHSTGPYCSVRRGGGWKGEEV